MDEQRDGLILIVEDDEATKGFLADNLAADGFRVASASSAAEGLRAIEVRRPCLVLLDLRLEGGSGLDVLDRVRAADGLATRIDPDLPVMDDHVSSRRVIFFRAVEPHSRLRTRWKRVQPGLARLATAWRSTDMVAVRLATSNVVVVRPLSGSPGFPNDQ